MSFSADDRAAVREGLELGERLGLRYALQIPQVAPSGLAGSRLGRHAGSSIDFQDYREYQPGDDVRFVDWGVYARTDRLSVKLFREEVTPHLDLVIDGSRSMNLEGTNKARAVAELAAFLATAAANAQCTHAVWLSGEGFRRLPNDTHQPAAWQGPEFDSVRTVDEACGLLSPGLRRLGMRVFISDLLWPGDPVLTVRRLRHGAARLHVIQVLARDDVNPPDHGSVRLVDCETEKLAELYIDAGIRKRYGENLERLQQAWDETCRQCGAHLTTVIAEDIETSFAALESAQLIAPA